MQPEIEAKFLDVDHQVIRQKLAALGAQLEKPMRLMRRTIFDYPDNQLEQANGRLRVRDEGDKVTITFKSRRADQYSDEIETTVGSYETMVELLQAVGFRAVSIQESKRETWRYQGVEIELDAWPWVKPYIEIEGKDEAAIRECGEALGFDWKQAVFGSAESVYRAEYLGMTSDDKLNEIAVMKFDDPLPAWLEERRQA